MTENEPKGGHIFVALLFLLLAVGGLFLGMLGTSVSFLQSPLSGTDILKGSLLGYIITFMKNVFSVVGFKTYLKGAVPSYYNICVNFLLLALLALIAVAAVLSLVLFICSFFGSAKSSKNCAVTSGVFTAVSYFGTFALLYCTAVTGKGQFSKELMSLALDPVTGIIGGAAILVLLVYALVRKKGFALSNFLQLLLPLAMLFAFTYPSSIMGVSAGMAFDSVSAVPFSSICLIAVAALLLLNLVISLARLGARKGYGVDLIRFGLLFIAAVLIVVSFAVDNETNRWTLFTGEKQLLPTLIFLIAALASFLLAGLMFVISAKSASAAEEVSPQVDPEPEPAKEEPVAEPEPEPVPEVVPEEEKQPAPAYTPVISESAPFSQWEREMAALAAGQMPAQEPAVDPSAVYPPSFQFRPPLYQQPSYYDGVNQYTYDPFINSLTIQEKNEFGDIFIAHKNGKAKNLPVYVIGGDNEEFFRTVWIRYNSFGMSPSLKEKVYLYLTSKD